MHYPVCECVCLRRRKTIEGMYIHQYVKQRVFIKVYKLYCTDEVAESKSLLEVIVSFVRWNQDKTFLFILVIPVLLNDCSISYLILYNRSCLTRCGCAKWMPFPFFFMYIVFLCHRDSLFWPFYFTHLILFIPTINRVFIVSHTLHY